MVNSEAPKEIHIVNLRSPLKTLVLLEFIKSNIEVEFKDIRIVQDETEIISFFKIPKPTPLGDSFSFLQGFKITPELLEFTSGPYTILTNLFLNRRVFSKILNL